MAKLTTDELIEAFKELSLIELSDFVKKFEEVFEVTAAAPVAVAAAAPAAGGAAGGHGLAHGAGGGNFTVRLQARLAQAQRHVASAAGGREHVDELVLGQLGVF